MTCGARFGYATSRGRVTTAVNCMEPLLVVFGVLIENDAGLLCRRRRKFQPRCEDWGCETCRTDIINCVGLTKMYLFGVLAQSFLLQLPLFNRHEILCRGYGSIQWSDIDWRDFLRRETGNLILVFKS